MENYDGDEQYCMTTEELVGILGVMQKYGLENVHITGGEPLRRKDLVALIGRIASLGMKVELNTNGLGLNKEKAQQIKAAGVDFLKISLDAPNRSSFLSFTGVDAFERVIEGIKATLLVMPVRLNCVVMRSNKDSITPILKLCNEMGVQQIHLLDLTYYPCVGGRTFWEREFVHLTQEVRSVLEKEYGNLFEEMAVYGCRFYRMETVPGGTVVVLKEAEPTMRIAECTTCDEYCHEGVFTLRMSAGGYLNFCPCNNSNGVNALEFYKEGKLGIALERFAECFDRAKPTNSFGVFLDKNRLHFKGRES
jgi:molybdenum cofactor biosynthesis enzyme MoaA